LDCLGELMGKPPISCHKDAMLGSSRIDPHLVHPLPVIVRGAHAIDVDQREVLISDHNFGIGDEHSSLFYARGRWCFGDVDTRSFHDFPLGVRGVSALIVLINLLYEE